MIKMIIQMDNQKIIENSDYSVEQIYNALDKIFKQKGIDKRIMNVGIIEYIGSGKMTDFANFGKIMLGLKNQEWFMNNAKKWIYCNNDDSENPDVYEEEDLLAHYGRKTVA